MDTDPKAIALTFQRHELSLISEALRYYEIHEDLVDYTYALHLLQERIKGITKLLDAYLTLGQM